MSRIKIEEKYIAAARHRAAWVYLEMAVVEPHLADWYQEQAAETLTLPTWVGLLQDAYFLQTGKSAPSLLP